MVANAVEGFAAQIEWRQCNVGSPLGMVVAAIDVRAEGIFACMAARAVPAIVAEGNCFSESNVETKSSRYCRGNLGYFESMSKACALVVVGKDEHLSFAGEAPECVGMQDAVSVALETCAKRVGFFECGANARAFSSRGEWAQKFNFVCFAFATSNEAFRPSGCDGIGMGKADIARTMWQNVTRHGGSPLFGA